MIDQERLLKLANEYHAAVKKHRLASEALGLAQSSEADAKRGIESAKTNLDNYVRSDR